MIAIIDYGAGNIQSIKNALDFIGVQSVVTGDTEIINDADKLILPGVGSFGDAMDNLKKSGLDNVIRDNVSRGKPIFGICLGMQLLFETSQESEGIDGLGILKGKFVRIHTGDGLKVPHVGWNSIHLTQHDGIFQDIAQDSFFYFVHSYYLIADNKSDVGATTQYGVEIQCAVQNGNVCGTQFHPEKSSDVGLKMLKNFVEME